MALVPINERSEGLSVGSQRKAVTMASGQWSRIKAGPYKGDLCQVIHFDPVKQTATIKVVPRVDWESEAAHSGVPILHRLFLSSMYLLILSIILSPRMPPRENASVLSVLLPSSSSPTRHQCRA